MLEKILSSGRTEAERAALDVSIKFGIPYGGWISKGRLTENGPLPFRYHIKETPTRSPSESIQRNIVDADGTLILSCGILTPDLESIRNTAVKLKKPLVQFDLNLEDNFLNAARIGVWLSDQGIRILHVTGPSSSQCPGIYSATVDVLNSVYYLGLLEYHMETSLNSHIPSKENERLAPRSVDEAVEAVISNLDLKIKAAMAGLTREDLIPLKLTLGHFIARRMKVWGADESLKASFLQACREEGLDESDTSMLVIVKIWRRLRKTHGLRVIK